MKNLLTIEDFKGTRWLSCYKVLAGYWVKAELYLEGEEGHYEPRETCDEPFGETTDTPDTLKDSVGNLTNIIYQVGNGIYLIEGNWSFKAFNGWFRFESESDNPDNFTGTWGFGPDVGAGGRKGEWNGRRSE